MVEIIEDMVAYEILIYPEIGQEEKKVYLKSAQLLNSVLRKEYLCLDHFTLSFHPLFPATLLLLYLTLFVLSLHISDKFLKKMLTDKHMFSKYRGAHLYIM